MPLHDRVLMVSGRVSFEIVQKAAVAGIPIVCAVSAPSDLAIETAERLGVTLVGFLRGDGFNVYAHDARIDLRDLSGLGLAAPSRAVGAAVDAGASSRQDGRACAQVTVGVSAGCGAPGSVVRHATRRRRALRVGDPGTRTIDAPPTSVEARPRGRAHSRRRLVTPG